MQEYISVQGCKVHNLKNIDVKIPRNKLVVITGISGSGKSSLAFDTIYAEAQRRYLETFSVYARQFIGELKRPDVEKIEGLSPLSQLNKKQQQKTLDQQLVLLLKYMTISDYFMQELALLIVK